MKTGVVQAFRPSRRLGQVQGREVASLSGQITGWSVRVSRRRLGPASRPTSHGKCCLQTAPPPVIRAWVEVWAWTKFAATLARLGIGSIGFLVRAE
jgi:hypothetical protein